MVPNLKRVSATRVDDVDTARRRPRWCSDRKSFPVVECPPLVVGRDLFDCPKDEVLEVVAGRQHLQTASEKFEPLRRIFPHREKALLDPFDPVIEFLVSESSDITHFDIANSWFLSHVVRPSIKQPQLSLVGATVFLNHLSTSKFYMYVKELLLLEQAIDVALGVAFLQTLTFIFFLFTTN